MVVKNTIIAMSSAFIIESGLTKTTIATIAVAKTTETKMVCKTVTKLRVSALLIIKNMISAVVAVTDNWSVRQNRVLKADETTSLFRS
jgi:hypothetical protein